MAKNNELDFNLPSVDDLFEPAQGKDLGELKKIIPIKIKDISDFPNHPFRVVDDEKMNDMIKSVQERGIMFPAIVRPKADGCYEMISGHRRKRACELAQIDEIPCIIRNLTDEEQYVVLNCIECNDATPSHAQAIVLKKLSQEGNLTVEKIEQVLGEEKPNQIPKYKLNQDRFADVLPKNVKTEKEVEDFLYNCAVEHNKRIKMREMSR